MPGPTAMDLGTTIEAFLAQVARMSRPEARLLLLDYDGTLAPFQADPAKATPFDGVRERLEALLASRSCRVVLVTGRAVEQVLPLVGLSHGIEVWGSHGWERSLPDGAYEVAPLPDGAEAALDEAAAWLAEADKGRWRAKLERKPVSVAAHWRGVPAKDWARLEPRLVGAWGTMAGRAGLRLHRFDGGWEVRVPGRDKGTVVEALLKEAGPDATAAYLGDDLTDEDAFRALKGQPGGLGVLVRSEPRPTEATARLPAPDGVLAFLDAWQRACAVR